MAHFRHRRGLTALSINWGPWAQAGMAAELGAMQQRRIETTGLQTIDPDEALAAFEHMLAMNHPQTIAMKVDWSKFSSKLVAGIGQSFFDDVGPRRAFAAPSAAQAPSDLFEQLKNLPKGERMDLLADAIERQASAVLGIAAGKRVDRQQSLHEIGLDSLMAVELRNILCQLFNCTLPPTLLFDYPTIKALVDHLSDQVLDLEADDRRVFAVPQKR